jgi:hypothetical protein
MRVVRRTRRIRDATSGDRRHALGSLAAALVVISLTSTSPAGSSRPASRSPARSITQIEYEGTVFFEGHGRRPGDVHPYHSRQRFYSDGGKRVRLDWTTWNDGDTLIEPEAYLFLDGRVFHRDRPGRPWRLEEGPRRRQARLQALGGLPEHLERVVREEHDPLAKLSMVQGRLERLTRLQAHPRLGDVRDSVAFVYQGASAAPETMSMAIYERDANWRMVEHRVDSSSQAVPESLFAAPASFEPAHAAEEQDTLGPAPTPIQVAPGAWIVELADIESRTMIVEFADHLAVIEAAVGSANGERIVDAARRQWPNKPVRYVMFSHHHPHYAGGLRALIAEGAKVVTTPGNEAFVVRVASLPFKTRPDRLARHPRPAKVVTFTDRYELADPTNRLVAINYGNRSQHTDEFVVFWLPRQKLMFESELGWVPVDGALRGSRRAKTLLAWIDEQKLDVDRFAQSWPMLDVPAVVTRAELDSLTRLPR